MTTMRKDGKVLVVETSPLIARAIEAAGELPVLCDSATDGWEAIGMLEEQEYSAIVIDSDLPRHSGFGVITYLREEVGEQLDNVIVVTSSDRDDLRRKLSDEKLNIVDRDGAVAAVSKLVGDSE